MSERIRNLLRTARSSARELLIVVVGILTAFALEAWWNAQADRRREAEELRGLDAELSETRTNLVQMIEYEDGLVAAYDTILSTLEGARPAPRVPIPRRLVGALLSTGTYDPPMGRVESLIASGNIGVIRNDTLRERIAGWPATVSNAREHQTRTRDFWMNDFAPSLRQLVDMGPLWRSARDTTITAIELPTSAATTNLVYQLRFHARIVANWQRSLRDELIKLQEKVQVEERRAR